MKNKTRLGLLLGVSVWGVTANAQSAITCDRECLRGKVTQLLYAFLKHDVSKLPVAGTLRVTEDAVEKPLAKVGLVGTVTRLRGFRQDIIDERASAEQRTGSWWEAWSAWVLPRSGDETPAPSTLGSKRHPGLEPAPGSYVLDRVPARGRPSDVQPVRAGGGRSTAGGKR